MLVLHSFLVLVLLLELRQTGQWIPEGQPCWVSQLLVKVHLQRTCWSSTCTHVLTHTYTLSCYHSQQIHGGHLTISKSRKEEKWRRIWCGISQHPAIHACTQGTLRCGTTRGADLRVYMPKSPTQPGSDPGSGSTSCVPLFPSDNRSISPSNCWSSHKLTHRKTWLT